MFIGSRKDWYYKANRMLKRLEGFNLLIPGHPAELSDSVKLLLTDAKSYVI